MSAEAIETRNYTGKVLVTGASGHLGANLVRRLLEDGRDVRVLLRHGSDNRAMDGLSVESAFGDLRDLDGVMRAMKGVETVYHCAAKVSTLQGDDALRREIYESNVIGTRHVLQAAKANEVLRTVVTGSLSAVGYHRDDPSRPADESVPIYPFDRKLPYARTKEMVEHECLRAAADGQDVIVATSCAILGPADYKPSRMGKTLIDYAHGKLRAYIPGGFEFVSARDLSEGHILCMNRGRSGHKYIFSTQYLDLDALMDIFEEVTGRPRPRVKLPPRVMLGVAHASSFVLTKFFPKYPQRFTPDAVKILQQKRRADISKAKDELSYEPTSIRKAIHDAYADFARRGLVPAGPTMQAKTHAEASTESPSNKDDTTAAA